MVRLILLTTLVMSAFAANSVLNRMALLGGEIGAMEFALWRVASGALALAALTAYRHGALHVTGPGRITGVGSLALYLVGFSIAYRGLDAGVGALILFGFVQITMFAGAVLLREPIPIRRIAGAAVALAGLAWLFWPGGGSPISLWHGAFMAAAAVGWGVYSLEGRKARDPLGATAANFIFATPVVFVVFLLVPSDTPSSLRGIILALISGTVTSALGYALWYSVLPALGATRAAVAQLSVPIIAIAGGGVLLAEPVTRQLILAAAIVLGGVLLSLSPAAKPR
ncbi:MAG: DMT family transporter [Pseudomonadota bacterium]